MRGHFQNLSESVGVSFFASAASGCSTRSGVRFRWNQWPGVLGRGGMVARDLLAGVLKRDRKPTR